MLCNFVGSIGLRPKQDVHLVGLFSAFLCVSKGKKALHASCGRCDACSQSVDRSDRDRVTGARLRGSVVDIVVPPRSVPSRDAEPREVRQGAILKSVCT